MVSFGRRKPGSWGEAVISPKATPESAEEAATAADRLQWQTQRLKLVEHDNGRDIQTDGIPHGARENTAIAATIASEFSANAFAVLDLALDARQERINEAVDELSFEPGRDPRALEDARARLLSARERLAQEIAWLPELSPEQQAAARLAVRHADAGALRALHGQASGLARINLAFAIASFHTSDIQPAIALFADIAAWNPDCTQDRIDEARARAGFRPIDPEQWNAAVTARLAALAERLAPVFATSPEGRARLTGIMQRGAPDSRTAASETFAAFLEAIQQAYAAGIEEALARLEIRIQTTAQRIRATPTDATLVNTLIAALGQWSSYRRPIQVMEAARSLDDQSSSAMFKSVCDLSIELSNDHQQHEIALLLAQALLDCFSHLPNRRKQLERQMPVLMGNVAFARLVRVCEKAAAHPRKFVSHLNSGGLGKGAQGIAAELVKAFENGLCQAGEDNEALFVIVRDMAVQVHNSGQDRNATRKILQWLLEYNPPASLAARLRQDLGKVGALKTRTTGFIVVAILLSAIARCGSPSSSDDQAPAEAPQNRTFASAPPATTSETARRARLRAASEAETARIRASYEAFRRAYPVPGQGSDPGSWIGSSSSEQLIPGGTGYETRSNTDSDWGSSAEAAANE